MSIKIASMNFGDCDTILHNTPNGMKNIAEVLGPNGEVYWSATKELTGIPPLSIRSNGTMLLDYLISGNMSQTGTPTPTTPIQPQETGERTGNLAWTGWAADAVTRIGNTNLCSLQNVDGRSVLWFSVSAGYQEYDTKYLFKTDFKANTQYTFSFEAHRPSNQASSSTMQIRYTDDTYTSIYLYSGDSFQKYTVTSDAGKTIKYIRAQYTSGTAEIDLNTFMVNEGTTPLPYELYGYKIPISSGGENLFEDVIIGANVTANGSIAITPDYDLWVAKVTTGETYTANNVNGTYGLYTSKPTTTSVTYNNSRELFSGSSLTITIPEGVSYIAIRAVANAENVMLNRGSTALPYEPYNRTTTPIYLGEVPTTRRIKKLVLTGEENWNIYKGTYYITVSDYYRMYDIGSHLSVCSHYPIVQVTTVPEMHYGLGGLIDGSTHTAWNGNIVFNPSPTILSLTDWKSYLAQQYANGTPVTIWYVLAEPTTGIVNEPIRKIGDYADTVSYEQAGVQIPTVKGNTVIDVETELKPSEMYIKYK